MPKTSISFDYDDEVLKVIDEIAHRNHCSRSFVISSILRSVIKKPVVMEIHFNLVEIPVEKADQEPQPQEAPKQE
jgi:hypothetical protein